MTYIMTKSQKCFVRYCTFTYSLFIINTICGNLETDIYRGIQTPQTGTLRPIQPEGEVICCL